MKHLLGLELYEGARLAGESVSLYLKERVGLRDKRVAANKKYEEYQKKLAKSIFHFEESSEVSRWMVESLQRSTS